jgi:hypothetical protein
MRPPWLSGPVDVVVSDEYAGHERTSSTSSVVTIRSDPDILSASVHQSNSACEQARAHHFQSRVRPTRSRTASPRHGRTQLQKMMPGQAKSQRRSALAHHQFERHWKGYGWHFQLIVRITLRSMPTRHWCGPPFRTHDAGTVIQPQKSSMSGRADRRIELIAARTIDLPPNVFVMVNANPLAAKPRRPLSVLARSTSPGIISFWRSRSGQLTKCRGLCDLMGQTSRYKFGRGH